MEDEWASATIYIHIFNICTCICIHIYMYTCIYMRNTKSRCQGWWYSRCSLLHLECHSISISNLNLIGLFSTKRGERDPEN